MDEVMRQETDRLVRVAPALDAIRDQAGEERQHFFALKQSTTAAPIDRVDMSVDLHKSRDFLLRSAVPEGGEAAIPEAGAGGSDGRGDAVPGRHEHGQKTGSKRSRRRFERALGVRRESVERAFGS